MNCKNCYLEINLKDDFCKKCGAKIVRERITLKSLFSSLTVSLGWESNIFVTLRFLLYKPQIVIKEYINGTRKKYTNPFTFFAIGLALSLFIFGQYSDELIKMSTNISLNQAEIIENSVSDKPENIKELEIFGYKNQEEFKNAIFKFQLKYYNLVSFLFLPFYTLLSFLVFRKPYNFGEHLVINTYLQGILLYLSVLVFIFSLLSGINIFGIGIFILPLFYYSYTYKKLNNLSFGQVLVKILKLIGILLIMFIITVVIGVIIVLIKKTL